MPSSNWNKTKKHQKAVQRKEIKRRRIRKRKLIAKRKSNQGLSHFARHERNLKRNSVNIKAPDLFSFIENTEEFITFLDRLSNNLNKSKKVFLRLKNVQRITNDAIVVLSSIKSEFEKRKIGIGGDKPSNERIKDVFEQSGFFNYVRGSVSEKNKASKNSINTHKKKNVDQVLTAELIGNAAKTVWGTKKRCPGVQRALIECMGNTFDHAAKEYGQKESWWLSVNHDERKNIVSFGFVDYGVGIFASLFNKPNVLINFFKKVSGRFKDDAELFELIIQGEMQKSSSTGLKHRGKGLPGIYNAYRKGDFDNLIIISNNVYADFKKGKPNLLKTQFSGTFLFWEINENSNSLEWIE